jgi:two-component system chemotaxis response regulator CheY
MKSSITIKFLIVDDIKQMRAELSAMCRSFIPGAKIDEAADVLQAMEFLQKGMPPYDAVFTDINMPTISGLKLISHLRDLPLYKKTPVIVVSSLGTKKDIERG